MDSNITGVSRLNKPSYSRQLRTSITNNIWELIANPSGKPSTVFVFNNNSECFFLLKKSHPVSKTRSKKERIFFLPSLFVYYKQLIFKTISGREQNFLILKKRPVPLTKYYPHGTTSEKVASTTFICCFGW